MGRSRHGITRLEGVVVAALLLSTGAVVVPGLARVGTRFRQEQLRHSLRLLRRQVHRYHSDHLRPPGGAARAGVPGGHERAFIRDLTSATEELDRPDDEGGRFGPYLRRIPTNPINGSNRVLVVSRLERIPAEPVSGFGWLYVPETLTVRANCFGGDRAGRAYFDY